MLKLKYGNTYIPPMPRKEQAVQVSQTSPSQPSLVSGALSKPTDVPVQTIGEITPVKPQPITPDNASNASSHQIISEAVKGSIPESLTRHALNYPKEAEEVSKYLVDKEIQELEEARRRKHDEASKQNLSKPDARSFLEEVKVTLIGEPSTYKAVLERLLECFGTTDT